LERIFVLVWHYSKRGRHLASISDVGHNDEGRQWRHHLLRQSSRIPLAPLLGPTAWARDALSGYLVASRAQHWDTEAVDADLHIPLGMGPLGGSALDP
jgi:hypothetical protein